MLSKLKENSENSSIWLNSSTVINTSKEMLAYSDFPPPAEWPNFFSQQFVYRYLTQYAEKFDLVKRILYVLTS